MDVNIRPENHDDRDAIRHVNNAAFGGDVEANLVDALRDGGFAEVSLVAELDDEIVGHILFSPVSIMTSAEISRRSVTGTDGRFAEAPAGWELVADS